MDLSVIIVNYNTKDLLRACMVSVLRETREIEFETIVVDNASSDGSREMLERQFPQVVKIFNASNRGFAAANNQGLKIARGSLVLLLNSDTLVLDGAIQSVVRFISSHPEASIVGCKLLNADGSLQPSCMSYPSVWNLFSESFFFYKVFARTKLFGRYHMSYFTYDHVAEVDIVKGAFMMVRREVFDRIGGFDESYFMYTEEADFCFRARRQGFGIYFFPSAQVIHYGGGSIERNDHFFRQFHESQLQFIRKHFVGWRRVLGVGLKLLGVALRIPVYALAGIVTLNRSLISKAHSYAVVLGKLVR